jgi:beta-galactosidase/beta-glucuronidase
LVGTQVTAYTNSVFDITDYVRPGKTAEIELLVEGRKALVGPDGRYTVPEGASWSDDVAQGIFRSADLEVFPAVYISDTVVRTSVTDRTLSYDVYLTNATAKAQTAQLSGSLSSWNHAGWRYPTLGDRPVSVPAGTTTKVTVGPLPWRADQASYWWPNVPYRAGYRAQLHELDVRLDPRTPAMQTSTADVRFGFRELRQVGDHFELNGRRVNFRGDSIQGANSTTSTSTGSAMPTTPSPAS